MSAVLGVSAHYHDSAAALVIDGHIAAAVQEERLSRIKNDPSLPIRAARACLDLAGLDAGALDAIVFYENPYSKLERVMLDLLRRFPRTLRQFPRAIGAQLGGKIWILDKLGEALDVPRSRIEHVDHHRSHAASAFFPSRFDDAAILVVDAVGEHASTSVWHGSGTGLRCVESLAFPHSLGYFYAAFTAYLGFAVNEGEYKVMGLAAHGEPRFRRELERVIELGGDGSFSLALPFFAHMSDADLGFGPRLEALLGPRRPPGLAWDLATDRDRRYADVAATVQAVCEDAMLGLARRARARTGASALCLAGGVALNAVANGRIEREAGFDHVFVQPAAGDAGGALGAAILGALDRGDGRPPPMTTAALGVAADPGRARAVAEALGLRVRGVGDPHREIAARLARGDIVAMATGRCEWGPRALGQRSILAAPSLPATRERLNRAIKRREPFRPFAPAMLAGDLARYVDREAGDTTRFMTSVASVLPAHRADLGAVTHVDGTARVQSVDADSAPQLCAVLRALDRECGVPIALNTSMNGPGEPICGGADDAVAFFLSHPVDALFVGDVAIERSRT